jgi:hypothetical protein
MSHADLHCSLVSQTKSKVQTWPWKLENGEPEPVENRQDLGHSQCRPTFAQQGSRYTVKRTVESEHSETHRLLLHCWLVSQSSNPKSKRACHALPRWPSRCNFPGLSFQSWGSWYLQIAGDFLSSTGERIGRLLGCLLVPRARTWTRSA